MNKKNINKAEIQPKPITNKTVHLKLRPKENDIQLRSFPNKNDTCLHMLLQVAKQLVEGCPVESFHLGIEAERDKNGQMREAEFWRFTVRYSPEEENTPPKGVFSPEI